MKVYLSSKKKKVEAIGVYSPESGEIVVSKGSILSLALSESKTFRGRKAVEKMREGVLDGAILKKDIKFKSPSTAANFITGGSSNGMRLWKTKEGISIGDLRKKEVE